MEKRSIIHYEKYLKAAGYDYKTKYTNVFLNVVNTSHRSVKGASAVSNNLIRYQQCNPEYFKRYCEEHDLMWWDDYYIFNGVRGSESNSCKAAYSGDFGRELRARVHYQIKKGDSLRVEGDERYVNVNEEVWTPVNIPELQSKLEYYLNAEPESEVEARKFQRTINSILDVVYLEKESPRCGYVRQIYGRTKTNRRVALGMSLQNAPREVVAWAMKGKYKYDMENAQLHALTNIYPEKLEGVEYYIENKKHVRKKVGEDLNVPTDTVKEAILMWVYGGSEQLKGDTALLNIFTSKQLKMFLNHKELKTMFNEVRGVRESEWIWEYKEYWWEEIERERSGDVYIHYSDTPLTRYEKAKALCYILQGKEAEMMETLDKEVDVLSWHYDAVVLEDEIDPKFLEDVVFRETGMVCKFSREQYNTGIVRFTERGDRADIGE